MSIFLHGLALANYRSFGPKIERIHPFSKINIFAGLNNSGKSNILRFLHEHLTAAVGRGAPLKIDRELDVHRGKSASDIASITIGLSLSSNHSSYPPLFSLKANQSTEGHGPPARLMDTLQRVLRSRTLTHGTSHVWFDRTFESRDPNPKSAELTNLLRKELKIGDYEWQELWRAAYPNYQGGSPEHWTGGIIAKLDTFSSHNLPTVVLIPAIRRIGEPNSKFEGYGGLGIIDGLAQLQDPRHHEAHKRDSFNKICEFLRHVVGNDTAEINVPYQRDEILVRIDGKTLPLDSLGTGIHEVVILAAAATLTKNMIVCLEEPELHLHPLLERKLLDYLRDRTSNQYFITTHSPHILDAPGCSVFHVRIQDGSTQVQFIGQSRDRWELCRDIGCRPSDLVQANCVIWVEGPSDRIYLNHWINAAATDLVEGIHYTLMFYGGRLLSHLSAKDPEVTEFISLCTLNRNLAIVIDSDRSSSKPTLNETKLRIKKEFEKEHRIAWVTAGREIENYVDPQILTESVEAVREGFGAKVGKSQYGKALPTVGTKNKPIDKVAVAHKVADQPAVLNILDLRERIDELVKFIRSSSA